MTYSLAPTFGPDGARDSDIYDSEQIGHVALRVRTDQAQRIVHAVNSHDVLLAALNEIVRNDPYKQSSAGIIARKALAEVAKTAPLIVNKTIEVDGYLWKIREATSMDAAKHAINTSRVRGSIGGSYSETLDGKLVVHADVVRLNDDGSERKAYQS